MSDRSNTDWPLVTILFCAGLLAAAQFAKLSFGLPQAATAFDRPVAGIAFLVTILGLVGLLGGVMAGSVVAALGARRVLLASLLLGAAISWLEALLPALPVFTALRVLEGVSHLGIVVAAPPLMAGAASDRDRPVVMSIWAGFFAVAYTLSAVAVPALVSLGGLPLLFVAHGVALLASAALLAPRLDPQARVPLNINPLDAHWRIYSTARLAAPGAGFVFYTFIFVALVTLVPLAVDRMWLAVALPVAGLGGTFLAGPILRRASPADVAAAGFAAVFVLALFVGLGWWPLVVPMFVMMGMIPAAAFAMIPDLNPDIAGRAHATGCIAQLGNVGTTLGTPIFALCLDRGGLALMFGATGLSAACGLVVVLWMRRIVRASEPLIP